MRLPVAALTICLAIISLKSAAAGPLHDAARTGDRAGVERLLDTGVDIDEGDGEDKAPLYHASEQNHVDVVQLLIEQGADPDRIRNGLQGPVDAAIHAAVKNGNADVIRLLAAAGASLWVATIHAGAPLHVALQADQIETAELLRSLGAADYSAPSISSRIADADVELGEKLARGCSNCHALRQDDEPGGGYGSTVGPDLWSVVGRTIASVEGFEYSEALSDAEGVWSYDKLNSYLSNPTATVPGTAKWYLVADERLRVAIIGYLRTLSDNLEPLP